MRNCLLTKCSILLVLLLVSAPPAITQTAAGFEGQWVMKLGSRSFLVLKIGPERDGELHLTGFMFRPQHFRTSDGYSFSQISKETIQEPITRSKIEGGQLTIILQNPSDPEDEDTFHISLADSTHLKIQMAGVPIAPFTLTKTAEPSTPASDWDQTKTYSPEDGIASNSEMQRIFEEDQKVRQSGVAIDWVVVSKSDADRREATQRLLNEGKLHTGEDFEHAAFLFQHGSTPNDYLLAHTLAMIAVKKGQNSSLWIATATLDRYLQSIHRPQIYGTQYFTKPNQPTTQEPYDRTLISDALRKQLGVPPQAAQDEQRRQYDQDQKMQEQKIKK